MHLPRPHFAEDWTSWCRPAGLFSPRAEFEQWFFLCWLLARSFSTPLFVLLCCPCLRNHHLATTCLRKGFVSRGPALRPPLPHEMISGCWSADEAQWHLISTCPPPPHEEGCGLLKAFHTESRDCCSNNFLQQPLKHF